MLAALKLKNLAIIEELEADFDSGMNVITGETGAGKSIMLKGLELLAGGKVSADLIRHGAERCEVEALFRLPEALKSVLAEKLAQSRPDWDAGVFEDDEVIVRRVIDASGKGKIYINGRLSSKSELAALAPFLFDIVGQHAQQSLLDEEQHLLLLDRYAADRSAQFQAVRGEVRTAYAAFSAARRLYDDFRGANSSRAEYFRRASFERDELRGAALHTGEKAGIQAELALLSSYEALCSGVTEALQILDDGAVERALYRLAALLQKVSGTDKKLSAGAELAQSAHVQVEELKRELSEYAAKLEADPEKIEALRERLAEIAKLERKYGKAEDELIKYLEKIEQELSQYESGAFDEEKLREQMEKARAALDVCEEKLSGLRKNAAAEFARSVEKELAALNMKRARFAVEITARESGALGKDSVQFLLSANPGEPPRPLHKIASGGELSRVLLLLKSLIHEQSGAAAQIFDEVDAGIGGAIAQAVGEKIKSLTAHYQVIVITHAPQIASLADRHILLRKEIQRERTRVRISVLDEQGRVGEIARMLAGKKVSDKFEASARELLGSGN